MIVDAILLVKDFNRLIEVLRELKPELLQSNTEGVPVVTGFDRTPAVVKGSSMMVYARFREAEVEQWRGTPEVEVLAESMFTGKGTAEKIYSEIFNDPVKLAKYDSVYDRAPKYTDPDSGKVVELQRPWFGILSGA